MREVIQAAMEGQIRGVRVEHTMSVMRFGSIVVFVGGDCLDVKMAGKLNR
jgi:hypothetical protein